MGDKIRLAGNADASRTLPFRSPEEVADRFVVLFRGTKVADVPKSQTSIDMLSELITTGSVSG